jgi:putative tryptophan/tyrosine transport system substrate-binding protein
MASTVKPSREVSSRRWVALAAALVLLPQVARAQEARRPYRIAVLNQAWSANHPTVEGLRAGLKAWGLEDGRDVTFDIRFTKGQREVMPAKAAELIERRPDLIFTSGDAAIKAAYEANPKIPIVYTLVGEVVIRRLHVLGSDLLGNTTGVLSLNVKLAPKRLEILKTLAPTLRRVRVVYPAGDATALAALLEAQGTAGRLRLEVVGQPVFSAEDVQHALEAVRPGDGLLAPDDDSLDLPSSILETARRARVPAVFPTALWVDHGGFVSYGPDYHAQGMQAARLVAKILRGARPRDLPVEGAEKIDLAINLKTASLLGVSVPRKMLLRADRIQR